jgi:AcrR family transcriptional regulator
LDVPRLTAANEQKVRQRIIDAAIDVFGELGYQRATIQDVVRKSGLSVGAVYTHFKNKEQLFVVACACEVDAQKSDLRLRMAELGSVSDRLRTAIDFAVESSVLGADERGMRVHAWMVAEDSPELRQILRDQRTEMVAFSRLVLQEAVVRGELAGWIDVDGLASAFVGLVDGFIVRAAEGGLTIEEARREAYVLLELLLAACPEMPAGVAQLRARAAALQS